MKVKEWPIKNIIPYEKNPRKNDAAVKKVMVSLEEYGWQQPIVVDGDGIIIVGHTRLKAAKKLKYKVCPVLVADDLTPAQTKAYRIMDNKSGEMSEWDMDLLQAEIEDLIGLDFDVELTGFDPAEFDIEEEKTGLTDEDAVPEVPEEPVCKLGDLWLLGDHRVLCGDSTDRAQVELLMNGEKADMVLTDPPYNVNYTGGTSDKLTIENDNMDDRKFYEFLLKAYMNYFNCLKNGGCIYVAHADTEGANFRRALTDSGLLLKQCLIWVKNSAPLSRQDYNWKHEPILYGWKPGAAHYFCGDFTKTTVIQDDVDITKLNKKDLLDYAVKLEEAIKYSILNFDRPTKNVEHPTMKPVLLLCELITNSSRQFELCTDFFLGSGSTLIACEKTNRKCYGMELDEHYTQVILQRWADFTGKDPIREDGVTFSELKGNK